MDNYTTATVKETFAVLTLDDDGCVVDDGVSCVDVDQLAGEELEVWKQRCDGFYFVYSERLEIGYWVNPRLIEVDVRD